MTDQTMALARAPDVSSPFSGDQGAFETAQRVAKALAASSIVPTDYRGNVPNVIVAMEYANRLGASVLAVMQNLDVIHGRPALRSTFLIGTVNASGRFSPIRFRWQGKEGTDSWGCRAVATDRESGEECVGPLVTIGTAKAEEWYSKKGSKWKTIPELMLMYRAGAWWTRVYCPELSLGIHTTDELQDITEYSHAQVVPSGKAAVLEERLEERLRLSAADTHQLEEVGLSGELAENGEAAAATEEEEANPETKPAIDRARELAFDLRPAGADATPEQRKRIREHAAALYGEDDETYAQMVAVSSQESLGKRQAGLLVGLLKEAVSDVLRVEGPASVIADGELPL
jgi:hypothetical protein